MHIVHSINKTGFLGFIVVIRSFTEIFQRYFCETEELEHTMTYRMSQDHLETFFGAIRAKGGNNNNPTVVQFKAAHKRLILDNQVTASAYANCQNFNDITQVHVDGKS